MNEDKTEYMLFGDVPLSGSGLLSFKLISTMKNLGVTFDHCFKIDKQIDSVVRASFYQLRLLSKVKPFLNRSDLEKTSSMLLSVPELIIVMLCMWVFPRPLLIASSWCRTLQPDF